MAFVDDGFPGYQQMLDALQLVYANWADREELRDEAGKEWHEVLTVRQAIKKATGRKPLAEMPGGYTGQHSARKIA